MSTQLASTADRGMYVGDFSNCLFGIRNNVEIEASAVSGTVFQRKMVAIRGLLRADFGIGRANDVVRLTGITSTTA